jgi:hypothetical protein
MTKAGRCRWKIENECFNTLKNQGYHLEHNYGHGQKNLSYNMYLFTYFVGLLFSSNIACSVSVLKGKNSEQHSHALLATQNGQKSHFV